MSLLRRPAFIGLLAACATGLPLLLFVEKFGVAAPLALFEGDAFYYLDITRNSLGRSGFSFDGAHLTNGFHPLWQYLLSLLAHIGFLQFAQPFQVLSRVFTIDAVLLACGAGLFAAFAARSLHRPALALLIFAPGLLWFAAAPITTRYLATWSYANGMESAVSLLFMGLALLLLSAEDRTPLRDILFSLSLGLAVLSRLDDVFFAIALAFVALRTHRNRLSQWMRWFLPAAISVLLYMLYNRLTVGVFLPLSGAAKASWIGSAINFRWTLKLLIPALTHNRPGWLPGSGTTDWYIEDSIRAFQMVVPMAVAAGVLVSDRTRKSLPWTLKALSLGVLLKGLYNFFFVGGSAQGHWYYTVSIAVANLLIVWWVDQLLARNSRTTFPSPALTLSLYVLLVSFSCAAYYGVINNGATDSRYQLIQAGPLAAQRLRQQGDDCFMEFDDGIVSYALQLPAEAGLGLALDREATQALHRQHFLDLMEQRHCTLVLSFLYSPALQHYVSTQGWLTGGTLFAVSGAELRSYRLVPQPSPEPGLVAYRIEPRSRNPQANGNVLPKPVSPMQTVSAVDSFGTFRHTK